MRILVATGLLAATAFAGPASAQTPALVLKTNYPGLVVQAGRTTTFDIDVITSQPRRIDLSVVEAPQGWSTTLRGGGSVVSAVFGDPETPPELELEVRVPADAGGEHRVILRGTAPGVGQDLVLTLRVGEQASGAVSISADSERFRGAASDTFTINATIENNTPEEATFTMSAQGPPGWVVSATPTAEQRAATVNVDAGGEAEISVSADPPEGIDAGTYEVTVTANGGQGKRAETTFEIEITGSTELTLQTADERLNVDASAGSATDVTLVVKNDGSGPLNEITFSPTPPTGWEVRFNPETIETIAPGEEGRATAQIIPSEDAVAGDYSLQLTASAANGGSGTIDLRVAVQSSRFWLVVGLLLIAATFFGLRWVFQRYGRR